MDESKKALIAEVQEITGKGKGEQPTEMPLARLTREMSQISTGRGRMELGSPAWETVTCPQCKSELRYYTSRYYEPPYVPLKCPVCEADLGIIGAAGGLIETVTAQPWPPEEVPPEEVPPLPPAGFTEKLKEFCKQYWLHLTIVGGLGIALVGTAVAKYRKKR